MTLICQLKDGYMLAKIGNKYAAMYTGYPYPDTLQPSQVRLDKLVSKLGLESSPKYTIEYLISVMSPYIGTDMLLSETDMCDLLTEGRVLGIVSDKKPRTSIFFDCALFTIYYIENITNSAFFAQVVMKSNIVTAQGRWCFVIHYHKDLDTLCKSTLVDKSKIKGSKQFDETFRQVFGISVDKMAFYYNELYKVLPKLGTEEYFLSKNTGMEQFHICSYKAPAVAMTDLKRDITNVLGLGELYYNDNKTGEQVKTALIGVFGYNVLGHILGYDFAREYLGFDYMQLLALYSCAYNISSEDNKQNIAKDIDDLLKDQIKRIGFSACHVEIDINSNGDLVLLSSPYVYYMYKNNLMKLNVTYASSVLTGSKSRLELSAEEEICRVTFEAFTDMNAKSFEKKLLYYFVAAELAMSLPNITSTNCRDGHSVFSLRNVLKTIIPNFDRLVLMGAIENDTDFSFLLALRFSFTCKGFGWGDRVPRILDSALDEMDCFAEEEKSFITMLPFLKTVVSITDGGNTYNVEVHLHNANNLEDKEGYYTPRFRDSFIERVRPVFEMFALTSCIKFPEYGVARLYKDYTREFSYFDDVFSIVLKKRS